MRQRIEAANVKPPYNVLSILYLIQVSMRENGKSNNEAREFMGRVLDALRDEGRQAAYEIMREQADIIGDPPNEQ